VQPYARVRDAEAAAASARARAIAAEGALADSRAEVAAAEASIADVERREAELAGAVGKMQAEWAAAAEAAAYSRDDADTTRALANDAAARAARALEQAHTAAERRVAEAVRKERLNADQKAREIRLTSAAARRATRGGGGGGGGGVGGGGGSWGGHPRTPSSSSAAAAAATAATSPVDARYKAQSRVDAALRREADAWAAARHGSIGSGVGGVVYRPPPPMTTPYTPAHEPIPMNMTAAAKNYYNYNATGAAAGAGAGGGFHDASASGSRRPFASANYVAPSGEAKRRAEARVANMKQPASPAPSLRVSAAPHSSSSTARPGAVSGAAPAFTSAERRAKAAAEATAAKSAGLAAKLARAESELRTALASRDGRSAEVEALRRRAAAAEAAVTERDARLAAAHRRAAAALASPSSSGSGGHARLAAFSSAHTPPRLMSYAAGGAVTWADAAEHYGSSSGGHLPGAGAVDQLTNQLEKTTARRLKTAAAAADSSSFSFPTTTTTTTPTPARGTGTGRISPESRAEVDQLARGLLRSSEKVLAATEEDQWSCRD
jgi:hypothetical protein